MGEGGGTLRVLDAEGTEERKGAQRTSGHFEEVERFEGVGTWEV